jgi:cytochrome c-type biogenesis protein
MSAFGAVRRHRVLVTRLGGAMLVLVGVLLVSGAWDGLIGRLQGSITGFETVI